MSELAQAGVGTAHLSSELDEDGPYTIHGVALGAGDITIGSSGIKKQWPGEELKEAAETLAGQPLVKDHENNSDGTIGTVTDATYREGVGVLYEAEIAPHYEQVAKDIAAGILEVSARAYHDPVEELDEDEATGAKRTTNIVFDNLSVVSQGAAPSNTANIGEAATMAQGPSGDTVAVMEQGAPRMDAAELAEVFEENESDTTDEQDEDELGHVYEIGDMIEWGDDRLGSVTGVFVEDGIHKYEVRVLERTETGVQPTDETETVIAHNARRGPHIPTSDMIIEDNKQNMTELSYAYEAELASFAVGDLVEWEGEPDVGLGFGTISSVDGDQYTVVPVGRDESGAFEDLNDEKFTVDGSKLSLRQSFDESAQGYEGTAAELASFGLHAPEYSGTTTEATGDGRVTMSDFDTDDLGEIAEHFLLSESGYPPDSFGDLKLPVVTADGNLSLPKLRAAKRAVGSVNGLDTDLAVDVLMMINRLIMSEFPNEPLAAGLSNGATENMNTEELQGTAIHEPEFSDTTRGSWDEPALEDFTDNSWDDLDQDMQSEISDHYIVSKAGDFPPPNFGDLALPVVEPQGNLNLNALRNAKARAGQVEGVGSSDEEEINNIINRLAEENFENVNFSEDEESEDASAYDTGDDRSVAIAALADDDARSTSGGQSTWQVAALRTSNTDTPTMTHIDYDDASEDAIDDMDNPVVIEQEDVEDLSDKAARAEELDDRLDDVNSTLDELAQNQEALESVDEDRLDELREYEEPHVLTKDEYEELSGLVDEIGGIFADELAEYSPFDAEELQERFTPMELRDKVEDHEDASVESELADADADAEPKGESASSEELEQSDEDAETEATAEELREAVAKRLEDDGLDRQAAKVRSGDISLSEMGIDPAEAAD